MFLEDQIALVSGASRGIGKAIAVELASQGATVIGTATTEQGAASISDYLQESGGVGMQLDVTDSESMLAFTGSLAKDDQLPSILVNNAGITRDNLMLRMKDEDWDAVIETNLSAMFRLTRFCLRPMMKSRWGRIINITSVVGVSGNAGQCNYAASKAGMIGFTKSLAQEVASRGITVNAVAPGFIQTDMTDALGEEQKTALLKQIPLARLGEGKDIAAAVSFLASDNASYITGETIHINGGMYMP